MKKGIIFDIDGTIWDATVEVTYAWNLALREVEEFNIQIDISDMMSFMGITAYDIGEKMLPASLSHKRKREIVDSCLAMQSIYQRTHHSPTYENAIPTIRELSKKYNIYIVSNCPHGYIDNLFLQTGLSDVISDYEYHGRTGLPKSGSIKVLMERNSIDKAVYLGDTDGDYRACKEAGIPFIHAAYGYGNPHEPTPSISSFNELPEAVAKILD